MLVILLSIIFRFFVTWCVLFLEHSKNIQNHHIIIFLYKNKNCHREGMEIKKIKRILCRRRSLDNVLKKEIQTCVNNLKNITLSLQLSYIVYYIYTLSMIGIIMSKFIKKYIMTKIKLYTNYEV